MNIQKTAGGVLAGQIDDRQLELINSQTRRPFTLDEIYTFTVILCDNEIDRDFERFTSESIEKLAELFKGKTGLFDHLAKSENQSARIYDTRVEVSADKPTSLGEPYCCLKAWAYMPRCDKNSDLILEIDAGIKKEVSVGCAVGKTQCSICREDIKNNPCSHRKGQSYDGKFCHHLLIDPQDAYEWSFVAVPAQKNAGVTKKYIPQKGEKQQVKLEKWLEHPAKDNVTLSPGEHEDLCRQFASLQELAKAGEEHISNLRRRVVKLALLSQQDLDCAAMESVAAKMNLGELVSFEKSLSKSAGRHFPIAPQTFSSEHNYPAGSSISQFSVGKINN